MNTGTNILPVLGKRIVPLLVMVVVGIVTVAWQPQRDQGICDPATGQNCATSAQSSKHKRATSTPAPTPTPSPTATSPATATSTATQTASPAPTDTATSTAAVQAAGPAAVPPTTACVQCGPAWPLIGGGAALFGAIIVVCFYLFSRRPLRMLPGQGGGMPGQGGGTQAEETGTMTIRDGGLENFTVTWRDEGLGNATINFQDPGGFENTIGGKDINDLTGSGTP